MTERTSSVPGPAGTDVLSDALRLFRLNGAMLLRGDFSEPWALDAPESRAIADILHPGAQRLVIFHIVADGECWVEFEGGSRETLKAGDVVIFPQGHAHTLGCGDGAARVPVNSLFPPLPWTELPALAHGGGGRPAQIVCAYLRCDELLFNPFLEDLPPMLCMRPADGAAQDWFRASVRYLVEEARSGRPGTASLTARMAELLFIEILRLHISSAGDSGTGWLAALADRCLCRALHALHVDPCHPWTLDELARHAGVSRSALIAKFRRCLAQSPMQYLGMWRLQVAAQRLRSTGDNLATIAAEVGYGSEEAFSRAFKRCTGLPPAAWRRERRGEGRVATRSAL